MKRGKVKRVILVGIVCVLLLAAASWYSVTYNEARLVVPMDYSTYVFRPQDLPMIAAILVFVAYIVYLVLLLVRAVLSNRNRARNTQVTRNGEIAKILLLRALKNKYPDVDFSQQEALKIKPTF